MHAYFAEYTDTNTRSLHLFFPAFKLSKEKTQTALKKAHGSRLKESSANKESHSAKQENNQLQKETRELQKPNTSLAVSSAAFVTSSPGEFLVREAVMGHQLKVVDFAPKDHC